MSMHAERHISSSQTPYESGESWLESSWAPSVLVGAALVVMASLALWAL
ncbi:MAG TPA: hypothetical protein VHA77_07315 [Xanthobacteraceae bacterium]|jgi:hypothetical protein|nr:hypothetical protein [Xanthobacteraceae bacterium]